LDSLARECVNSFHKVEVFYQLSGKLPVTHHPIDLALLVSP
jgi:hypothetical protein